MGKWQYTKGLHDLGNNTYAYLQPDGSWGWSNAGLIVDGDQSLLVDTLFDLKLTQEMLDAMRASVPASKAIGSLVNTHANADPTFGNELVSGAEIIASTACAEEMSDLPPGKAETRARFDAGMPADKAAYALDAFASWSDAERIVTTVDTLYREFRGESGDPNIIGHFGAMARYRNANSHSR